MKSKTPKKHHFWGRSFALGFVEGGHYRRLLCAPTSLFYYLLQVLDDLDLELDLWWRREKTNLVLHLLEFLCNTAILMFCNVKAVFSST